MRHVMMLVPQDQWDEIWNKTPPSWRMVVKSPFGPAMRVVSTYADCFILSCGGCEAVAAEGAREFVAEALAHPMKEIFYEDYRAGLVGMPRTDGE